MTRTAHELTCREITDRLAGYFGGELDAEERSTFEGHVAACRDCVTYLRSYAMTMRLAQAAYVDDRASVHVPEQLLQAVLAARPRRPGG
ncbi:MAG TPA: zf-HC2 domain-containing protein [Candidatus Binatus sp.]|nr:zf-HC2 domain-containing protein [Candidatus Binatus sp.]